MATLDAVSYTNRPAVTSFGAHEITRQIDISAGLDAATGADTLRVARLPVGARITDAQIAVLAALNAVSLTLQLNDVNGSTTYDLVADADVSGTALTGLNIDPVEHFGVYTDDADWIIQAVLGGDPGAVGTGEVFVQFTYILDAEDGEFYRDFNALLDP